MSRALRLAVCAIAAAGTVASAQNARGDGARSLADSYRERRDSLSAWVGRTERTTDRVVTARRSEYSHAVTLGSVTVESRAEYADLVMTALLRADSMIQRLSLGGPVDQKVRFRLHPPWDRPESQANLTPLWILDVLSDAGAESGGEWWNQDALRPDAHALALALHAQERNRRTKLLPQKLREWHAGGFAALEAADRWEEVYTKLASSPTTVGTACLVGNLAACRQVLLLDATADPLLDWFTPSSRRSLVLPYAAGGDYVRQQLDKALPGALTSCVEAVQDAACLRILREYMSRDGWGDPMRSPAGREALIVAAIQMPGAPGLRAIMGRQDLDVTKSLEAVAGRPVNEVVGAWMQRMRAAEPDRVQLPASRVLTATAWVLIFGACALGGSRWRSQ